MLEPDEGHAESLLLLLDIAYVVGDSFPEPESVDGDMVVDLDLLIPDCHRLGNRRGRIICVDGDCIDER
jgi:hypothetical protein